MPKSWAATPTFCPLTCCTTNLGTEILPQACPNTNLCIPNQGLQQHCLVPLDPAPLPSLSTPEVKPLSFPWGPLSSCPLLYG